MNIAVIMGGFSSEVEISLKTGAVVVASLSQTKYSPYAIHILSNKWVLVTENGEEFPVNKHDFSVTLKDKIIHFDCVFNAIHGAPGEDGTMQAYFELLQIPHTSCGAYQAALTFNKRDCLSVLKPYGILTAESYYYNQGDEINEDLIVAKVGLPCFVKANRAGSSFGVTKVYKADQIKKAIDIALKEDNEILIETFLDGKEVSIGVIKLNGAIKVLPATELVSENDFFDYGAKYLGQSREITPARLSKKEEELLNETASKIYSVLKMDGFTRSEFIFKDGIPHFLEINTVPGLTKESILPQQAEAAGISMEALFVSAIEESLK